MHTKIRILLGMTVALAALVPLGRSASAASLGITPGSFAATSQGLVTFTEAFGEARCNITLGGSLHRGLINKVRGNLLGLITEARTPSCSQGEMIFLTLPPLAWHIRYGSITGTLPSSVTSVVLEIFEFSYRTNNACLMSGIPQFSLATTLIGGSTERYTSAELRSLEVGMSSFNCRGSPLIRGRMNVSPTLTITRN
jgi:hypothetical protein